MRIRYLALNDLPPLLGIDFVLGNNSLLVRRCAIRFLVGVNGSGKSRLLQAITALFVQWSQGELPDFAVNLLYDLHDTTGQARTVLLRHDPQQPLNSCIIPFSGVVPAMHLYDWRNFVAQDWRNPPIDSDGKPLYPFEAGLAYRGEGNLSASLLQALLPTRIVAYTSGETTAWKNLMAFRPSLSDLDPTTIYDGILQEIERPLDWTSSDEEQRGYVIDGERSRFVNVDEVRRLQGGDIGLNSPVLFIDNMTLPLATLAVALWATAFPEAAQPLQRVWGKINWERAVSLSLRLEQTERATSRVVLDDRGSALSELEQLATTRQEEGEYSDAVRYIFDLASTQVGERKEETVAEALYTILGGTGDASPFEIFARLVSWQRNGILRGTALALRKTGVEDLLLLDDLSDGERMLLGRIALLYLLHGQNNALLLLDEPESHFNDLWKRELVDMVDEALQDDPVDVLIATHSAIALTDVFDSEITLVQKDVDGRISVRDRAPLRTFGASPTEIMHAFFGVPSGVGRRASDLLEAVIRVAQAPTQLDPLLTKQGRNQVSTSLATPLPPPSTRRAILGNDPNVQSLEDTLLPPADRSPLEFTLDPSDPDQQRAAVDLLQQAAQQTQPTTLTEPTTLDALNELLKVVGPGYFQYELYRRLEELRHQEPPIQD